MNQIPMTESNVGGLRGAIGVLSDRFQSSPPSGQTLDEL